MPAFTIALAALLGCAAAVGAIEGVKALLHRKDARRQEEDEAADIEIRTALLRYAQSYVQGAIAGVTATAGPMHPGRVDEVREALQRAGVAEGMPLSVFAPGGEPVYRAVPTTVDLKWSEQAEAVAIAYRLEIEDANPIQRMAV